MKTPMFEAESLVKYQGRAGVVQRIINRKDPADVRLQGFRYEIQIGRDLWSVPELFLSSERKSHEAKP